MTVELTEKPNLQKGGLSGDEPKQGPPSFKDGICTDGVCKLGILWYRHLHTLVYLT